LIGLYRDLRRTAKIAVIIHAKAPTPAAIPMRTVGTAVAVESEDALSSGAAMGSVE
jgi:hypothetical protein